MRFKSACIAVLGLFLIGCTTTGNFRLPENTELYVHERPEPLNVAADGTVTTTPFFWTAIGTPEEGGGIKYRLERDGETIKRGRLRTKIRVVSFFWPPGAVIYWPLGFNPDITYDLVNDTQK